MPVAVNRTNALLRMKGIIVVNIVKLASWAPIRRALEKAAKVAMAAAAGPVGAKAAAGLVKAAAKKVDGAVEALKGAKHLGDALKELAEAIGELAEVLKAVMPAKDKQPLDTALQSAGLRALKEAESAGDRALHLESLALRAHHRAERAEQAIPFSVRPKKRNQAKSHAAKLASRAAEAEQKARDARDRARTLDEIVILVAAARKKAVL